jgi:DNA-binding NarL/FixJ family response regulator
MKFLRRAKKAVERVHDGHVSELRKSASKRESSKKASGAWTQPPKRRGAKPRRPTEEPKRPTEREVQILEFVAEGLTNTEIAAAMYLSEETVKSHVRHILAKLGAHSRAHAVALGYETGLLTTTSSTSTRTPSA